MKTITLLSCLTCLVLVYACTNDATSNQVEANKIEEQKKEQANHSDKESIFKELSDRVEKIDKEKGLKGIFKDLKKEDGTNVYDEVLAEIEKEDAESNGQVSKTIDFILKGAEEHMGGQDFADIIGDAIEKGNDFSEELGTAWEDLMEHANNSGYKDDIPKFLEGINDFMKTGGENGGVEKVIDVIVKVHDKENSGDSPNPLIEKLKEFKDSDMEDIENEVTKVLEDLLEQAKNAQSNPRD